MLNIAQKNKYYVNLAKIGRIVNSLDIIAVLWYNVTELLKNEGLHKVMPTMKNRAGSIASLFRELVISKWYDLIDVPQIVERSQNGGGNEK